MLKLAFTSPIPVNGRLYFSSPVSPKSKLRCAPSSAFGRFSARRSFLRCCSHASSNKSPPSESDETEYLSRLNEATQRRQAKGQNQHENDGTVVPEISVLGTTIPVRDVQPADQDTDTQGEKPAGQVNASPSSSSTPVPPTNIVPQYEVAARALWRLSWVAWWPQFFLTLISVGIVLFSITFPSVSISATASTFGLILTCSSIIIALVSLVNTYLYTRLSLGLSSSKVTKINSARLMSGLSIALIGLVLASFGLHGVIGVLLARLLTSGFGGRSKVPNTLPNSVVTSPISLIQPIDILVVQACANVILALLIAALLSTWFLMRVKSWDRKALER